MKVKKQRSTKGFSPLSDWFKKIPRAEIASPLMTEQLVENDEPDSFYFRKLEDHGTKLNANQLKAVRTTEGPVLINAGAGSGKTSVITARTGYLLSVKKVDPDSILLVTFTAKAAREMKERIGSLPGITSDIKRRIHCGTFHSVFLKILKENGYQQDILSSERAKQVIIKKLLRSIGISNDEYEPESLLALISHYKNNNISPEDIKPESGVQEEFKRIFTLYEEWKWKENKMDYDDILVHCYNLFINKPNVRAYYQNRYQYIICDEAQDTCPIQFKLIQMIAKKTNPNLCKTGDVDQSLYSFRSAEPEFLLSFPELYPGTKEITLDVNYRSTDAIVGIANDVIKHNKKRLDKTLKSIHGSDREPFFIRPTDEEEEAKVIVNTIFREVKNGKRYKDMAVLFRTHSSSRAMVDELVRRDVPFILHGNKNNSFYLNSFVKPILDLLRLSLNPNDEDALIGAAPLLYLRKDAVMAELAAIKSSPFFNLEEDKMTQVFDQLEPRLKPFQQNQLVANTATITALRMMEPAKAIELIRFGSINYDKYLEMDRKKTLSLHKEMVKEMIDSLHNSANNFSEVESFLNFVDRVIEKSKKMNEIKNDPDADVVQLMTVHASKGLEFDSVFAIGIVDDILPHKSAMKADEQSDRIRKKGSNPVEDALEEERRILYVCLSRAQRLLYISSPESYNQKEKPISRFLLDALQISKN